MNHFYRDYSLPGMSYSQGIFKEFFLHQSKEAGAFSSLGLHTQSKNLYFFYVVNWDHSLAKLFQESVFERLHHARHCHFQFLKSNHFVLWFLIKHLQCSLYFFDKQKKKVYYPKLKSWQMQ